MQPEIQIVLRGKNLSDVVAQAQALINAEGSTTTAPTTKKKAAPAPEVEDSFDDAAETEETETENFGAEEAEEAAPAKKAKKITSKDVNEAAIQHATANGRPATLKVLAKFKVKSILELEEKDFAKVIKALEV